jgi:hypothetical protein
MARRQRVSVKGRGADLFFGDLQPDIPEVAEESEHAVPTETAERGEDFATEQSHLSDNKVGIGDDHASMHARTENLAVNSSELISSAILDAIWPELKERATVSNAFRYTHQELAQLTDAIYQLGKQHGTKVTKQEVARLALSTILTDYQIRGADSLLSEFIARRADVSR